MKERRARFEKLIRDHEPNLTWKKRQVEVSNWMRKPLEEVRSRFQNAFEKQRSSMGVFSFAGTPRDILMWSHYAQDHTGVCLRFSAAAHLRVFVGAVGVTYSQSYPKLNWLDMAGGTVKALLSKASH